MYMYMMEWNGMGTRRGGGIGVRQIHICIRYSTVRIRGYIVVCHVMLCYVIVLWFHVEYVYMDCTSVLCV